MSKKITRDEFIKAVTKSNKRVWDKAYRSGAIHAMSVAVNQFNCPSIIRTGVFKKMKIKK